MLISCLCMCLPGKKITLKDIHNIALHMSGRNDLNAIAESLKDVAGI